MSTGQSPPAWPALVEAEIRPTVDHLHRLSQIGGKYTLSEPFEFNWGHVVLTVTPRGLATPLLRAGDVFFTLEYELLDDRLTVNASTGRVSIPFTDGSVAGFYGRFVEAIQPLGVPPVRTLSQPEIPGAPPLDEDREQRAYDPAAARRIWAALAQASAALTAWQAPYRGHRPRVGLMWGGFDLSATRYNGRLVAPPPERPVFQQNGMNGEVVAVGFAFGDEFHAPEPGFYAYIAPPPEGMDAADLGVPGATWLPDAGLIVLPWDAVRSDPDPQSAVLRFADAVYAVAVQLGGWPADLVGERHDGWYASRHPVPA